MPKGEDTYMLNEIYGINLKEDFLGTVYSGGAVEQRTFWRNGNQQTVRAYTMTSDKVANFTVYAPTSNSVGTVEIFEPLLLKNPQLVAQANVIGTGRDRNRFNEYYVLADGVSLPKDKAAIKEMTDSSEGRMLALKFKGGDVSAVIDVPKTFGSFLFNGYEPTYKYDEENGGMTDEVIGFELVVISSKTKKPYKVKCDNIDADFSVLKLRDAVTFDDATYRFYQDSSSTTQGSTISISVGNVKKGESSTNKSVTNAPTPSAETGKPKNQVKS